VKTMNTASLQVGTVANALTRNDATQYFAGSCENIHKGWASLLGQTTLPDNTSCTDSRVADAIRTLDNMIRCPENKIALRITYVQLRRMMNSLKQKVKDDRRQGLIVGKRSQRDATVAITLYLNATGRTNREEARELTRLSNRWSALAGRYPLLLTTFTDVAERIMYDSFLPICYGFMALISQSHKTRVTNHNLSALAEEICRVYPTALIVASDYVAKDAELAVRSGPAYATGRTQEVLAQVKKMLTWLEYGPTSSVVTEVTDVAATPDQSFEMRRIVWKSAGKKGVLENCSKQDT